MITQLGGIFRGITYETPDKKPCECVIVNRQPNENMRDWLKRCMCMFHWMQTDYYRAKVDSSSSRTPK